ncbi:MAG: DNA primase [Bacteroidota bacterium]|nr:DNA primase [Bacteroidota bacterium]
MIPKETIEIIFDTARIDEVIGDFISLKKRGVNFLGNCPFHNEKSPSFTVSPAKGIYKCFGCGKAGNAVNFVMEHEQYSYPEALRYLAGKYNIELEEEVETYSLEQQQQINEKESLFIVSEFAKKYFTDNLLNTEEGKSIGLSYFKERGFRGDIIEKFQLGYCHENRTALTKEAVKKGYKPHYLVKAGLLIEKDNATSETDKFFDRFAGRVMFPVHNLSGRVIAFGGRILQSNKKAAKYINSPETDIYSKSKVLYGAWQAKKAIINANNCYLVEGYTDVISFHQSGIENVVASSGTSLTVDQIKLIKRYTNNVSILFDGDEAGIKASLRGINLILEEGLNVKVVLFPDGEDPDSYAKKNSPEKLKEFIENSGQDFINFKSNLLLKDAQNDPIKRAELIKEIIQTIALIPDAIIRSVYVKESSSILGVAEQTLINELNKIRRKQINKDSGEPALEENPGVKQSISEQKQIQEENTATFCAHQEKDVIRILLNYGACSVEMEEKDENEKPIVSISSVAKMIIDEIEIDSIEFETVEYQKIYNLFKEEFNKEQKVPEPAVFTFNPDTAVSLASINLLSLEYELSDGWKKHQIFVVDEQEKLQRLVHGAIYALKIKKITQMLEKNKQAFRKDMSEGETTILLNERSGLLNIQKVLSVQLGRIIIK